MFILDHEKVGYDEKAVAALIMKHFPDYRRTLNDLQRFAGAGNIDSSILSDISDDSFNELVKSLKENDFKAMRTWVVNNHEDPSSVFRKLYDNLTNQVLSVPQLGILLADYQYKSAFVVDQEINLVACLTELMADMEFKS